MNTFRIEGTITTDLEPAVWWKLFYNFLGKYDEFKRDSKDLPLFPNGEDLTKYDINDEILSDVFDLDLDGKELSKQETNYDLM